MIDPSVYAANQATELLQLIGLNPNASVVNKPGLAAIVQSCLLNISPFGVLWKNDPQSFVSDQDRGRIVLDVFSIRGLAWDERRRVYGLPGYPANAFVTVLLGNRTVIVNVRAEGFDASVEAAEIIDQIRSNIYSDASVAALNAINLAYVSAEPAVRVDYKVDERVVNAALCDITFAGIAQHVSSVSIDGSGDDVTTIATVNTDNTVPGTLTP